MLFVTDVLSTETLNESELSGKRNGVVFRERDGNGTRNTGHGTRDADMGMVVG